MSEVITCSPEVAQYLRELVVDRVEAMLDDPHGVVGDGQISDHYGLLDRTCQALGLSLDGLVMSKGTEHERIRLWSML